MAGSLKYWWMMMFSSSSTEGMMSAWALLEVEGDAAAEPLEVLVPVEEVDLEPPGGALLAEEADALETEERGVEDRAGHAEDLGVGLEDVELLLGQEIAHLPGGPFHAFELGHVIPP